MRLGPTGCGLDQRDLFDNAGSMPLRNDKGHAFDYAVIQVDLFGSPVVWCLYCSCGRELQALGVCCISGKFCDCGVLWRRFWRAVADLVLQQFFGLPT